MGTRRIHALTATGISKLRKTGYHADGGGLYVQVASSGAKTWVFRYSRKRPDGKTTRPEMGLGGTHALTLAQARDKASTCRNQLANGIDPLTARTAENVATRLRQARTITFADAATQYIATHETSWKSAKHATQWRNTITKYCGPVFGNLAIADVNTDLVLQVLEPIWPTKCETASRLRGRIESVLNWAKSKGYRTGENPAAWKGHLDATLPSTSKVKNVKHLPALPFVEMPKFMSELRKREGVAARAVEFCILTAARSGEIRGATWSEIDLTAKTWTIPAGRMKMKREHCVPLSDPAINVLMSMQALKHSDYVFPGTREKKSLSDMSLTAVLRRMSDRKETDCGRRWVDKDGRDIVVHGFRSTIRDWVAECTDHTTDVVEMALAHAIKSKVEAAYRRGDLLEKRRHLMTDWAAYCEPLTVSGST